MNIEQAIEIIKNNFEDSRGTMLFRDEWQAIDTIEEYIKNSVNKDKIRNYLDTRINIVIDDKLNSKDKIQIATDEGIKQLLIMIRQELLEEN